MSSRPFFLFCPFLEHAQAVCGVSRFHVDRINPKTGEELESASLKPDARPRNPSQVPPPRRAQSMGDGPARRGEPGRGPSRPRSGMGRHRKPPCCQRARVRGWRRPVCQGDGKRMRHGRLCDKTGRAMRRQRGQLAATCLREVAALNGYSDVTCVLVAYFC